MRIVMDRRQALTVLAMGAAAAALKRRAARADVSELVWSTWESNGKPQYVEAFTKQTGTKIRQSYLSSEDAQFAAMKAGSAGDWDVVNPSLNGSWRYIKAGVLRPLDMARLPNAAMMYDVFKTTPKVRGEGGAAFAAPYLWGLNPIVYRADKYDSEPDYGTLFDARYKGQLAMRDYALESIAIAGLFVGVSRDEVFTMSDAQLAEAKKALIAQKPILRTYWQTIGDLTNLFATGEVTAAFSWRVPYDLLRDKMKMGMAKPKAGIMGMVRLLRHPGDVGGRQGGCRLRLRQLPAGAGLRLRHRDGRQLRDVHLRGARQADAGEAGGDLHQRPRRDEGLHVARRAPELFRLDQDLERGEGGLSLGVAPVLLSARGLHKSYGRVRAVGPVDLDIPERAYTTLLGPSGCGKTTLLRLIAGFEAPDGGTITLDGNRIDAAPPERRPVNTVFQSYALFPHLNVEQNVAFSLTLKRLPADAVRSRVRRALEAVDLAAFADRAPGELSGGQQQRVAVARAIVAEPRLLLLDEPLSALDRKMRARVQIELKDLQRRLGIAFVHVTHDQEEAFALSDLVMVMDEGAVVQRGSPQEVYASPATAFVADFIGGATLVPGRVVAGGIVTDLGTISASAAPGLRTGDAAVLVVRPEGVAPADGADLRATVRHAVFHGSRTMIELEGAGLIWRMWIDVEVAIGDEMGLALDPSRLWIAPA